MNFFKFFFPDGRSVKNKQQIEKGQSIIQLHIDLSPFFIKEILIRSFASPPLCFSIADKRFFHPNSILRRLLINLKVNSALLHLHLKKENAVVKFTDHPQITL